MSSCAQHPLPEAGSRRQLTDLSPLLQPMRISPLSRAPKRDHDEWLVRWMVGWFGSRAGPGLKYLGMGQFAGQAAAKRMGRPMQGAPGGKAAMHKAAGRGGQCRVARVVRPPMLSAMRHGMLPGPGTISPKTSRPARYDPHYCCGLTAARIKPRRPASLPRTEAGFFLINPRPQGPAGALSRPVLDPDQTRHPIH